VEAAIDGVVYELAVVSKVPAVAAEYHLITSLAPPGVAESVTTPVAHLAAGVTEGEAGIALMISVEVLAVPVIAGVLLTTLTLYPVPLAVADGMVAVIEPATTAVSVPIFTGAVNAPAASLNCAVKILPAVNVPVMV